MGDGVVVQHGQRHGNGDAVIAAQGRALGKDRVALHCHVQALQGHVLGAVGGFFADHIHMALEDHRRGLFVTGRGLLDDDHIVQVVLIMLQAPLLGERRQIVAESLGVARPVRVGAELFKKGKYALGLKVL